MIHRAKKSVCQDLVFATARAGVDSYQPALFHIKLLDIINLPFMVAVATQHFTLVFFLQGGFAKGNDLRHERCSMSSEQCALYGSIP